MELTCWLLGLSVALAALLALFSPWAARVRAARFAQRVRSRWPGCLHCGAPRVGSCADCPLCREGSDGLAARWQCRSRTLPGVLSQLALASAFVDLALIPPLSARAAGDSLLAIVLLAGALTVPLLSVAFLVGASAAEGLREGLGFELVFRLGGRRFIAPASDARALVQGAAVTLEGSFHKVHPAVHAMRALSSDARAELALARLLALWCDSGAGELSELSLRQWTLRIGAPPRSRRGLSQRSAYRTPGIADAAPHLEHVCTESRGWFAWPRDAYGESFVHALERALPVVGSPDFFSRALPAALGPRAVPRHPTTLSLAHLLAALRARPEALEALAASSLAAAPSAPALARAEHALREASNALAART